MDLYRILSLSSNCMDCAPLRLVLLVPTSYPSHVSWCPSRENVICLTIGNDSKRASHPGCCLDACLSWLTKRKTMATNQQNAWRVFVSRGRLDSDATPAAPSAPAPPKGASASLREHRGSSRDQPRHLHLRDTLPQPCAATCLPYAGGPYDHSPSIVQSDLKPCSIAVQAAHHARQWLLCRWQKFGKTSHQQLVAECLAFASEMPGPDFNATLKAAKLRTWPEL